VKTRIARDVAAARRPGRPISADMGTAGVARAEADRARIRTVLRAPSDWRAPATTSVPASTTEHGAAGAPPRDATALLELQRTVGNRAVRKLLSTPGLVQRRAIPGAVASATPQATAARGTAGPGGPVPHLPQIQTSFGRHDVSRVRAFTGGAAASAAGELGARAFAYGDRVAFASRPDLRMAAHEAAHVVQQRSGAHPTGGLDRPGDRFERHADAVADAVAAGRSAEPLLDALGGARSTAASVQRQPLAAKRGGKADATAAARPRVAVHAHVYQGRLYTVGMSAGVHLLIGIDLDADGNAYFTWANFRTNETYISSPEVWDRIYRFFHPTPPPQHSLDPWQRYKGPQYADPFADVAVALGSSDLHKLAKTPAKKILEAHESGKVTLSQEGVLSAYQGIIESEALRSLADNEKSVDALLNQPDRVHKLEEYAVQLKEASLVRDELVKRRDELRSSRPGAHAPVIGLPKSTGTLVDPGRLMRIGAELREVETALTFWYESFPLLTRIQTNELRGTRVETELLAIKTNIIATRQRVLEGRTGSSSLDLWDLDNVRSTIADTLGPKVKAVVATEDRRRAAAHRRSSLLTAAVTIGLLFLPGGIFLDAAIGVAMAAKAWSDARIIGQAANTSMHADEGLISRARASTALFEAVLTTVFAVLGGAAAGLSILRVARVYANVARAAPDLELAGQIRVTHLLLKQPGLLRAPVRFAELEAIIERMGARLSVSEIRGLRAAIFRKLGIEMPPQSAESLQEFLELVWTRRSRISGDDVYSLYSNAPSTQARLSGDPQAYKARLDALAEGRAGSFRLQGNPDRGYWLYVGERHTAHEAAARTTERLYLNVAADHAVETMEKVVRDIVDNPSINGVLAAKVAGPAEVGVRADAIVIYLENPEASRAVLGRLKALTDANPTHFNPTTPFMTDRMLKGVGAGMQPVGGGSFGGVRSDAIFRALQRTMASRGTRDDFLRNVAEELRRVHVDPAVPHLNVGASGTPRP
jgi:hypothetical protein